MESPACPRQWRIGAGIGEPGGEDDLIGEDGFITGVETEATVIGALYPLYESPPDVASVFGHLVLAVKRKTPCTG